MAAITRIKVHCMRQEDWTGSDDLDFYVETAQLGRITIASGGTEDRSGSTPLWGTAFVEPGQTIRVYEDDFDPDDLVLEHYVTADDIRNGLSTTNTSGDCSYEFDFEFVDI